MSYVGKCIDCRRLFTATEKDNRGTLTVAGRQFLVDICDGCRGERERQQNHAARVAAGR